MDIAGPPIELYLVRAASAEAKNLGKALIRYICVQSCKYFSKLLRSGLTRTHEPDAKNIKTRDRNYSLDILLGGPTMPADR